MTRRITVRFGRDKNGKQIAHKWGAARRWLPIGIDEAKLKLATDPRYQIAEGGEASAEDLSGAQVRMVLHAYEGLWK